MKWIPIEDRLPECYNIDGKKKKVNWVLGANEKSQFVCVYTKGHELEFEDYDPSEYDYDEVEERNGCYYLKPGWYELEETPGGEYDETWVSRKPTHWMPLPEPPTAPVDQEGQEFEHTERYETRLMLHRLIKWAKSVEGSKAPLLIENCQKILNKWGNVEDALRSSEPVQGVEQEGQDRGEMKDANEIWEEIIGYIETQQFIRTKYKIVVAELNRAYTTPKYKL